MPVSAHAARAIIGPPSPLTASGGTASTLPRTAALVLYLLALVIGLSSAPAVARAQARDRPRQPARSADESDRGPTRRITASWDDIAAPSGTSDHDHDHDHDYDHNHDHDDDHNHDHDYDHNHDHDDDHNHDHDDDLDDLDDDTPDVAVRTPRAPTPDAPATSTPASDVPAPKPAAPARAITAPDADDAVGWGRASSDRPAPTPNADDAVGWGGTQDAASEGHSPTGAPSAWSMGGRYRLRVAMWTEHFAPEHPLAQARNWLGLWLRYGHDFSIGGLPASLRIVASAHAEYDAAYAFHRADYPASTLRAYEWQFIPEETYAALALGSLELRAGWLKLALGQGEVLGFLDVLGPRDLRDSGLSDPEDMLLAVLGTRTSLALGDHRLELLTVQQANFGLRAPPLAVLSPLRAWLLRDPLSAPAIAARDWDFRDQPSGYAPSAWQALGHYSYAGAGIDLDLYAGSVLSQLGIARMPAPAQLQAPAVTLDNYHPRYALFGHTGALTLGQALLRWELTAELARPHNTRDLYQPLRLDVARYHQLNGLLGLSYFGLAHVNLGVELAQSYVLHNPARQPGSRQRLLLPTESPNLALRAGFDFLHERLQLLVVALVIGVAPLNGALVRGELSYLTSDALRLSLGYVHYYSASDAFGPFYGLGGEDRAYCALRWDFSLL